MLYLFTKRVSVTLHSRLAKHSLISGGATVADGTLVNSKAVNLSVSEPDEFPIPNYKRTKDSTKR
jgi:hypothetical protein